MLKTLLALSIIMAMSSITGCDKVERVESKILISKPITEVPVTIIIEKEHKKDEKDFICTHDVERNLITCLE